MKINKYYKGIKVMEQSEIVKELWKLCLIPLWGLNQHTFYFCLISDL